MDKVKLLITISYVSKITNICTGKLLSTNKSVTLKGNFPETVGICIEAYGNYTDPTNKIFCIDRYEYYFKSDEKVFKAYAQTFPKIGKKTANKIFEERGPDYNIFLNENILSQYVPQTVISEIIGKAKKDMNKGATKLAEHLSATNLFSKNTIIKLTNCVDYEDFIKNPYVLWDLKAVHIGFTLVNAYVLQQQNERPELLSNDRRYEKGVEKALQNILKRGHTYTTEQPFIAEAIKVLNNGIVDDGYLVNEQIIKKTINKLHQKHYLKVEKSTRGLRFYNAFFYDCEKTISNSVGERLKRGVKPIPTLKVEQYINEYQKANNIQLSDGQKNAVLTIVNNNLSICTGSAGTGKTTVLKAGLYALSKIGCKKVILAAPTGRAARRMAESTGREAQTLHSLLKLGIANDEEVEQEELYVSSEKIDADAVFVDEASMCDIGIITHLFNKCNPNTRIVFIGDPNQLPPVGSGSFLSDCIKSNVVPTVKLNVIYRQGQQSLIVKNANKVLENDSNLEFGDDFTFLKETDNQKIVEKVKKTYVRALKKYDLLDVQCITPMRQNGTLASYNINNEVQKAVNPISNEKSTFVCNGYKFYVNDKIICCKNTESVKNGDIGIVTKVRNNFLEATFDSGISETFTLDDAKDLGISLAYSITTHKSQGSEFDVVIMPISNENKSMLKRNLFYTAITRAKKVMVIVGDEKQIKGAINNNREEKRNSLLQQRINKFFK